MIDLKTIFNENSVKKSNGSLLEDRYANLIKFILDNNLGLMTGRERPALSEYRANDQLIVHHTFTIGTRSRDRFSGPSSRFNIPHETTEVNLFSQFYNTDDDHFTIVANLDALPKTGFSLDDIDIFIKMNNMGHYTELSTFAPLFEEFFGNQKVTLTLISTKLIMGAVHITNY